ncbi:MAG: hypothetical protein WC380_10535 [Pedobacter sp.]|jgi:hypothetical protein
MKNLIVILILLGFSSCGQKAIEDKHPAEQISFINFVRDIRDKVNAAEEDKALRAAVLDQGVADTKAYVKDSLNLNFNKWQAKLIEIKQNVRNPAITDLLLVINMDQENQSAEKSIVLRGSAADEQLSLSLKDLKPGDQLIFSGDFIEKNGFIDIDSYSRYKFSKNVFDNPEFKINIKIAEKL